MEAIFLNNEQYRAVWTHLVSVSRLQNINVSAVRNTKKIPEHNSETAQNFHLALVLTVEFQENRLEIKLRHHIFIAAIFLRILRRV